MTAKRQPTRRPSASTTTRILTEDGRLVETTTTAKTTRTKVTYPGGRSTTSVARSGADDIASILGR